MDIDLRLLRYFVAVAEELHFTRAADRLYLSQPALSNQIRRLEHELDVALFDRSTRAVRLTEAGEAFLPRAREALAAVSLGVTEALAAAGQADGLRLDILESALETPRAVLGQLRALYTALPVRTSTVGTPGQQRQILAGDLDVGLAGVGDLPAAIDQRVVRREPVGVALRADHPLAGLARVPVRALADQIHYLPRDDFAPEWNAFVRGVCREAGFEPRRHPVSTDGTATALDLVGEGGCVVISLLSTGSPDGTALRPLLEPAPVYQWTMRWRRAAPRAEKVEAVRHAAEAAARVHGWDV